jgi:hypothetical protein
VPGRFLATLAVGLAMGLACAPSAAAGIQISFDGEILRFRTQPSEQSYAKVGLRASAEPPHLEIRLSPTTVEAPLQPGPGCLTTSVSYVERVVQCPLTSASPDQLRYRWTLGKGFVLFEKGLRGVTYGSSGFDYVGGGDRVYGGPGNDELERGTQVYAGPGHDFLSAKRAPTGGTVLYGGPGNDGFKFGGLQYGGSGIDQLSDTDVRKSGDMLVGGPGRDYVSLARDRLSDVVRVRGGGEDVVHCPRHSDPRDALFVDRSDQLDPSCAKATVLYTERPRYPYP